MLLATLREQMDDDKKFFKIIKEFYNSNKYKLVESKDFIKVVKKHTGEKFMWIFDLYLYNNWIPELQMHLNSDGELYYKWSNEHNLKETLGDYKVKIKNQSQSMTLKPTTNWRKVYLDYDDDLRSYWYEIEGNSFFIHRKLKKLN